MSKEAMITCNIHDVSRFFNLIRMVNEKAIISVGNDSIECKSVDPTHTHIIDIKYLVKVFTPIRVGIDISTMCNALRILKSRNNDTVINLRVFEDKTVIAHNNSIFEVDNIDTNCLPEPNMAVLDIPVHIVLITDYILRHLKIVNEFGIEDNIPIVASKGIMSLVNNIGTIRMNTELSEYEDTGEEYTTMLDIHLISKIIKELCKNKVKSVDLYMSNEMPIKMVINKELITASILIAPRIES